MNALLKQLVQDGAKLAGSSPVQQNPVKKRPPLGEIDPNAQASADAGKDLDLAKLEQMFAGIKGNADAKKIDLNAEDGNITKASEEQTGMSDAAKEQFNKVIEAINAQRGTEGDVAELYKQEIERRYPKDNGSDDKAPPRTAEDENSPTSASETEEQSQIEETEEPQNEEAKKVENDHSFEIIERAQENGKEIKKITFKLKDNLSLSDPKTCQNLLKEVKERALQEIENIDGGAKIYFKSDGSIEVKSYPAGHPEYGKADYRWEKRESKNFKEEDRFTGKNPLWYIKEKILGKEPDIHPDDRIVGYGDIDNNFTNSFVKWHYTKSGDNLICPKKDYADLLDFCENASEKEARDFFDAIKAAREALPHDNRGSIYCNFGKSREIPLLHIHYGKNPH